MSGTLTGLEVSLTDAKISMLFKVCLFNFFNVFISYEIFRKVMGNINH